MIFITQPTYMPWIGYFSFLLKSKKIIFLDDVQFSRRSWQQRNKIYKENSFQYLTVPVKKAGYYKNNLNEILINKKEFYDEHLKTIKHTYRKSKFFDFIFTELLSLKDQIKQKEYLCDINILIILKIIDILNLKINYHKSSEFNLNGKKSSKLIAICNYLKEGNLLSNEGTKEYIAEDINLFDKNKIKVHLYKYEVIKYEQIGKKFIPYLSIIDLLFNLGPKSTEIILKGLKPINN